MKFNKKWITIIGLLFAVIMMTSEIYAGEKGIKVGTLTVKAIPGTGHNLIVRSSVDVEAVFTDPDGKKEYYIGEMGMKLGLDIGHKTEEDLGYIVISPSKAYKTGSYAMQGKYFGQTASISVSEGVSVRVMVGGFDKSFTLQPLAVGVNEGVGASLGIGYLYLQKDHRK